MGDYSYGERNERGDMLVNYLQEHQLFQMNSFFFEKKPKRKWTWISPDGKTKNEIDFIISNRKDIVHDVTVLNKVSIGSDHRMIRAKLKLSVKKERQKMITKTKPVNRWTPPGNIQSYQQMIEETLDGSLKTQEREIEIDLELLNQNILDAVKMAEETHCRPRNKKQEKLSAHTKALMKERREMKDKYDANFPKQKSLNKVISKSIRDDIRKYNTEIIKNVIEENAV